MSITTYFTPAFSRTHTPQTAHLVSLDYLRGASAATVVMHHIVGLASGDSPETNWFWVGAAGVDIFFVLSGFLMFGFLMEGRRPLEF